MLLSARLVVESDEPVSAITVKDSLRFDFELFNSSPDSLIQLSLVIYNIEGICIFDTRSTPKSYPFGRIHISCNIGGDFFNDESYSVRVLLIKDVSICLLDEHNILQFDVHDTDRQDSWFGKWIGVIRPAFQWTEHY